MRRSGRGWGLELAGVAVLAALGAGGRFGRRGALRATGAVVATRLLSGLCRVPKAAADTAAASALAMGAGLELPWPGTLLAAAPGLVGLHHVRAGRARADAVLAAAAVGAGVAVGSARLWPIAPRTAAELRPAGGTRRHLAATAGDLVTVVVNTNAGSNGDDEAFDHLRQALPEARLVQLGEGDDLGDALEAAAAGAGVLGAMGGDGTLNAAAGVAHAHGVPLLALPGGTLNHFARDVGLASTDDAISALESGEVVEVDLASIDGHCFLNTASFGGYVELVDARRQLEDRIGKWAAMLVALVQVLRRSQATEVEIDGRRRLLWMIFVGNCAYHPHGFAPSWRTRLDDGQLDVRLVDAGLPGARIRLVLAVLTGRLGRCRAYEQWSTRQVDVRRVDGDRRLARDGETFDGSAEFSIVKRDEPLLVYAPHG